MAYGTGFGYFGDFSVYPSLLSKVIKSQGQNTEILPIRDRLRSDTGYERWAIHTNGSLRYRGRVMVPQSEDLKEEILMELHCSRFVVHPSGMKITMIFIASITRAG